MLARYLSHIFRRYMCKNAPYNGLSKGISGTIFKFDELAAALDARLEAQVFAHFRELTAGRFAVLICAVIVWATSLLTGCRQASILGHNS